METDRFGVSDWLKSIGGVLFFVAGLLPWWEQSFENGVVALRFDAFSYQLTGLVPYVIFVAIAILTIIIRTGSLRLPRVLVDPLLTLVAAAVATVLVGLRFFLDGIGNPGESSVTRGVGLYLAAVSALLVLAGSIIAYRDRHDVAEDDGAYEEADDEMEIMERYAAERDRAARRQAQQPPLP